ncbi:Hypothetical predicted protein [Lynx pardinus]|uniref:LSM domain-containing protein n=1 Tax=Lynx pardinus TaxID=191816 RepID=A0A485NIQ9_LYNPA|nr:Hypothetical predicted protein [Lynx pardinus]
MSKAHAPMLEKFIDKKLSLKLNGGRCPRNIAGVRSLYESCDKSVCGDGTSGQQNNIGMVVIQRNSIIMLEVLGQV